MNKINFLSPPQSIILAIESSCDETSAAVLIDGKVRSNVVATQTIHQKFGGVVPELASRAHQQNIIPVVREALENAKINKNQLTSIAYTKGPGLLGALLVGSSFAKSFALALDLPIIEVNHMQAHILAHFIEDKKPNFPFICLTVSGGHTQLVVVKNYLEMEIIGQTLDDAVGEAFDKTAKNLNLPYPGGPLIDKYAAIGNPLAYQFPIVEMPELNFSFSGIKTAFLYFLQNNTKKDPLFIENNLSDICASIQYTLIQILLKKIKKASLNTGINEIAIAGGVSANSGLRKTLLEEGKKLNWNVYIPKLEYCTDNAAMIGTAAYYKAIEKQFSSQQSSPEAGLLF